jgi:asparagine synthase (glutamine-hydrolysing)
MCGICGIVHADRQRPVNEAQLLAMRESLVHRGPDDAGLMTRPGVGLASRRLAILDLSPRGRMPMTRANGRLTIAYNGEVYNHRELRADLESRGCTFTTATDTETLLALYEAEGPAMLGRLNGMFAFAIWDAAASTLFAARDRLGIKPFYYVEHAGALYFASEEKALFAAGVPAEFDDEQWGELLCFRFTAGERTPFRRVRRLLPGHSLTFSGGAMRIRRWWDYADRVRALRDTPPRDAARWFADTFDDAVGVRRIADVPVGVLLSGGLDSGSVAASLAGQSERAVSSFTVRFAEQGFDEGPLARAVAERWNLSVHEVRLTAADVAARLDRAAWLNDEPLAHASDIHLGAIAELAKPQVTVLLSGEGADETLGGYVRYQPLRYRGALAAARPFAPLLASPVAVSARARKLGRFLGLGSLRHMGIFNACEVLPAQLDSLGMKRPPVPDYRAEIWSRAEDLFPGDPMRQAMFSDQHTFLCSLLDRNDRMTMGASIECRVPFLDYRLVEGLAALPSPALFADGRKGLLKRAIGSRLPAPVLRGAKWGFGVPWSRYLRREPELRELVETLPAIEPVVSGPFVRAHVRAVVRRFLDGDDTHAALVRQLALIASWHRACCRPESPARVCATA